LFGWTLVSGVSREIVERLERNEPTAWGKLQTAQIVPPVERCLDEDEAVSIDETIARYSSPDVHPGK
jgi:hypothetical protein